MIISTNLTHEDIRRKYDERIYSRIIGEFSTVFFAGDDVRFQKE
jgi:DNA replication protein DnaC